MTKFEIYRKVENKWVYTCFIESTTAAEALKIARVKHDAFRRKGIKAKAVAA